MGPMPLVFLPEPELLFLWGQEPLPHELAALTGTSGAAPSKRKPGKNGPVDRRDLAPTWSGAFKRGLFGAAIFFLLFWLVFKRDVGAAAGVSVVMLAMYVPMGYYIDRFMYTRRLRKLQAERAQRKQQG